MKIRRFEERDALYVADLAMKTRCVHIFPAFENIQEIEKIREEFDDLYGLIEPHITIVFPFKSNLSCEQLTEEIQNQISDFSCFNLTLKGFSKKIDTYGCFLFLDVVLGAEELKCLHYKVHEGNLKEYQSPWTMDGSYIPHMTVGRFKDKVDVEKAYEKVSGILSSYSTVVTKIVVEIIGDNDESIIESSVDLKKV